MGVYVEVEAAAPLFYSNNDEKVRANADNLSLAVVDFENGGRSSGLHSFRPMDC